MYKVELKTSHLILFVPLLLSSCLRHHFYVQEKIIDRSYLASSHLGTPDTRQMDPPSGKELLVYWHLPQSLLDADPMFELTVRFQGGIEEQWIYPMIHKYGYKEFFFPKTEGAIVTYRVRAITDSGDVVGIWEHPLWTPLIQIGANPF